MHHTNWTDEVHRVDDHADEHVGDDIVLHDRGRRMPLRGTIRTEEGEIVEGASSYWGVRVYVSLQSRYLPESVDEFAIVEVPEPLDGGPARYYRVAADRDLKTGRRKLFLTKTSDRPDDSCPTREQRDSHASEREAAREGPRRTRASR